MTTQPKRNPTRENKIRQISQAHVAPGMSTERLNAILSQHHIALKNGNSWEAIPETTLDALIADIRAIVSSSPLPLGGTGAQAGQGGEL